MGRQIGLFIYWRALRNQTMETSAVKVAAYRDRQAALDRTPKQCYVTAEEWAKVKAYIKTLREAK